MKRDIHKGSSDELYSFGTLLKFRTASETHFLGPGGTWSQIGWCDQSLVFPSEQRLCICRLNGMFIKKITTKKRKEEDLIVRSLVRPTIILGIMCLRTCYSQCEATGVVGKTFLGDNELLGTLSLVFLEV